MTFGGSAFGSRSFGDTAPSGAGVLGAADTGAVEMTATLTLGGLSFTSTVRRTNAMTASLGLGSLFIGSSDDPGGGTGGDGSTTGGGLAVEVVPFRNLSLPFEYEFRFGDLYKQMGFTYEQATILEERDRQLEDFLLGFMPDLTWTFPGFLEARTSPRWYVRRNYRVDTWIASIDVVDVVDTVVRLLVSGVPTVTLTIPAGSNMVEEARYVLLDKDADYVQIEVVSVGELAESLSVQGILRR